MHNRFDAACWCSCGKTRNTNEDNFYFKKKHLSKDHKGLKTPLDYKGDSDEPVLFAVFDGMGGETRGGEASYIACTLFADEIKKSDEIILDGREFLFETCIKADKMISSAARDNQVATMGCTIAALYLWQDEIYACNVGDSRIFRIRSSQMIQISEDHTDEKLMTSMGITKKPVLLQYLGMTNETMTIDPFISKGDIKAGDVYIICSDGVTDTLSLEEIYRYSKTGSDSIDCIRKIMTVLADTDKTDNATIIIIKIK